MPIASALNHDTAFLETHATGLITADDLEGHLRAEEASNYLGLDELFDARGATTDLTASQVRQFVRRTEQLARQGRLGAVAFVTSDDVAFGMARMYQLLSDDRMVHIGVFRDIGPAWQWLATVRGTGGP